MTSTVLRPPTLTPTLRAAYLQLIEDRAGLKLTTQQAQGLEQAIGEGMIETGETDPAAWYCMLNTSAHARLLEKLAGRLTIGETHFFRVGPQIEALRTAVLPDLLRQRAAVRELRFWSAGCSTGEEVYTLAMLVHEQLPVADQWTVRLLGTDLHRPALDVARLGLYSDWSFRQTPECKRQRYFVPEGKQWRLRSTIRNMVEFRPLNLVTDSFPASPAGLLDLILCRNVTIYFSAQLTQRVYARLAAALAPDGYLVLGPSDPVPDTAFLEPVYFPGAILWRRPGPRPATITVPQWEAPSLTTEPTASRAGSPSKSSAAAPLPMPPSPLTGAVLFATRSAGLPPSGHAPDPSAASEWPEVESYVLLGLRQLDDGAIEPAIETLRRATFLDENNILAHFGLGRAYARSGNAVRARASLTHARRVLAGVVGDQLSGRNGLVAVSDIRHAIEMQLTSLDGKGGAR